MDVPNVGVLSMLVCRLPHCVCSHQTTSIFY